MALGSYKKSSFGSGLGASIGQQPYTDRSTNYGKTQTPTRITSTYGNPYDRQGGGIGNAVGPAATSTIASNFAQTQYGPQFAELYAQRLRAQQQADYSKQSASLSRGSLTGDYASNMARNRLGAAGLGLDRRDLASQRGMLGLDRAGLGLDRAGIGVSRNYIGKMQGYAKDQLGSDLEGINQDLATDQRRTASQYVARGAHFTPFNRLDLADNYASALRARSDTRRGYDRGEAGYQKDLANLGIDEQRIGLEDQRINYRFRDLDTAAQRLDLEAQRLGLDAKDYQRALDEGLAQLGLQGQVDALALADMLGSNNTQQAQLAQEMFQYAAMLSGNPALMALITPNFSYNPGPDHLSGYR